MHGNPGIQPASKAVFDPVQIGLWRYPMSLAGGLASGLAFLPAWLAETKDTNALDVTLSGWVRASGWKAAGLAWPVDPTPRSVFIARADGTELPAQPPVEWQDVVKSLRGGIPTVVWQLPGTSGRLYT